MPNGTSHLQTAVSCVSRRMGVCDISHRWHQGVGLMRCNSCHSHGIRNLSLSGARAGVLSRRCFPSPDVRLSTSSCLKTHPRGHTPRSRNCSSHPPLSSSQQAHFTHAGCHLSKDRLQKQSFAVNSQMLILSSFAVFPCVDAMTTKIHLTFVIYPRNKKCASGLSCVPSWAPPLDKSNLMSRGPIRCP